MFTQLRQQFCGHDSEVEAKIAEVMALVKTKHGRAIPRYYSFHSGGVSQASVIVFYFEASPIQTSLESIAENPTWQKHMLYVDQLADVEDAAQCLADTYERAGFTRENDDVEVCKPLNAEYEQALAKIAIAGVDKGDRTNTGTTSVFGLQLEYDLSKGFPIVTSKKTPFITMIKELVWMLSGDSNIKWLVDNNCNIWNSWADEDGELGPVYGVQWRKWNNTRCVPSREIAKYLQKGYVVMEASYTDGVETGAWMTKQFDQVAEVLGRLDTHPDCRRLVVNAWNRGELDDMALPPCHAFFQFYTTPLSVGERMLLAGGDYAQKAKEFIGTYILDTLTGVAAQALEYDDQLDALNVPVRKLSCKLYQR